MEKSAKIYVAGHRGMVGSAIIRKLKQLGYSNIVTRGSKELDLRRQEDVFGFFSQPKGLIMFFWLQLRLVAFMPIILSVLSSYTTTCLLRQTLFMHRT